MPRCAILVFRGSPPTSGTEKNLATQKRFMHCWFLCEAVSFRFCCFFSQWKGRKKTQPPKRGPCISAFSVNKVVLATVFIFLGQDVPGCAILVFPGNPPSIRQKCPKVVFDGFCMFLAKCCKIVFLFNTKMA